MGLTETLRKQQHPWDETFSAADRAMDLEFIERAEKQKREDAKKALEQSQVEHLLREVESLIPGSRIDSLEWNEAGNSNDDQKLNIKGTPLGVGFVLTWDGIREEVFEYGAEVFEYDSESFQKHYRNRFRGVTRCKGIVVEASPDGHLAIRGNGGETDLFSPTWTQLDDALEDAYNTPLAVYRTPQLGDPQEFLGIRFGVIKEEFRDPYSRSHLKNRIPNIYEYRDKRGKYSYEKPIPKYGDTLEGVLDRTSSSRRDPFRE